MKKLFTLILLTISAFTFKSLAQNTSCNAGFDFTISGLSVKFTAAITTVSPANHQYWSFGDGAVSSDISPAHVYVQGGTYNIKHYFYRSENGVAVCVDSLEKQIQLSSVSNIPCNASFTFAISGSSVSFTPAVTAGLSTQYWLFGDGTFSYSTSPTHTYNAGGSYIVKHYFYRTENGAQVCMDSLEKRIELKASVPPSPCNLTANFYWNADSSQLNKIHFLNYSSHFEQGDSIRWNFGDGTPASFDVNPTHAYTAPGTYNVCIRISKKNTAGTSPCVKEICKKVVVVNECKLEANFTFEIDASNKNKIYFKNTSTPLSTITQVQWTFGDGLGSASPNPDHIYAHAGTYRVCLKISANSVCYREICKTIEINEAEINCDSISKFSFTRSAGNCMEFKFSAAVQNPNWKYVWSFGDGTGSNDINPSHAYQRSGNYTVFLTVYKSATCVSTSHKVAETGTCFSCNNIWVKYEYKRETATSNKINFHAVSNYPITSQTWVITKLSLSTSAPVTLNQNNPTYNFNEPGDYRVCLRAITYAGCVKEYCEVIHISSPNAECTLTAYPNPTHNQVSVGLQMTQPEMIHVYIFNSLNILVTQKHQQGSTGNNVVTTNIESLVPGWYTIKVIYGNRVCYSKFQKI